MPSPSDDKYFVFNNFLNDRINILSKYFLPKLASFS